MKDANISKLNAFWEILVFQEQLLNYSFVSVSKPLFSASVNNF